MKEIPLTRGQVAIVDDEDYEWLSRYKWHCSHAKNGYAARRQSKQEGGKVVMMHRIILGLPDDMFGDHINGNTLDNRRCNLRPATPGQNQMNQGPGKNNKTGYKGVTKAKYARGYYANIQINGVHKSVYCLTAEDAARAYNQLAREWHGEYAYLNNVEDA